MSELPLYSQVHILNLRYKFVYLGAERFPGSTNRKHRVTSLIRNSPPIPRTSIGPFAESYCRVLGCCGFL